MSPLTSFEIQDLTSLYILLRNESGKNRSRAWQTQFDAINKEHSLPLLDFHVESSYLKMRLMLLFRDYNNIWKLFYLVVASGPKPLSNRSVKPLTDLGLLAEEPDGEKLKRRNANKAIANAIKHVDRQWEPALRRHVSELCAIIKKVSGIDFAESNILSPPLYEIQCVTHVARMVHRLWYGNNLIAGVIQLLDNGGSFVDLFSKDSAHKFLSSVSMLREFYEEERRSIANDPQVLEAIRKVEEGIAYLDMEPQALKKDVYWKRLLRHVNVPWQPPPTLFPDELIVDTPFGPYSGGDPCGLPVPVYPSGASPMASNFLRAEDRSKLIRYIAQSPSFATDGATGRRSLVVNRAGIERLSLFDFSGNPITVSGNLIGKLEGEGYLRDNPTYHALGALLTEVIASHELAPDQEAFLASVILRYRLVLDAAYLDRLKDEYDLDEAPASSAPVPPKMPTLPKRDQPQFDGPAFAPMVEDAGALETVLGSADNFLDLHLMYGALYAAQAVGRIETSDGEAIGTGFLVGPELLLTNRHVLRSRDDLPGAQVRFGYLEDSKGIRAPGTTFRFREDVYIASPEDRLDYSLVRLERAPLTDLAVASDRPIPSLAELVRRGRHLGFLVLVRDTPSTRSRVNIVQHPAGDPLKVVLTHNRVIYQKDTRLQYVADTKPGSSGSPVLNRDWNVVALHHSGAPYPPDNLEDRAEKAWKGHFRVNEGILAGAILDDIKSQGAWGLLPATHY